MCKKIRSILIYVGVESVLCIRLTENAVSIGELAFGSDAMHREPLLGVPWVGSPSLWLNKQDDLL